MQILNKDLLTVDEGIIIHQVNCQGVIGSGVAKQIANKYPKVKEEYQRLCRELGDDRVFGKIQLVNIRDKLFIGNLFTQKYYGRTGKFTDENMLVQSIRYVCMKFSGENVYAPYGIGCGLGGGNWDKIFEQTKEIKNLVYCKKE